MSEIHTGPLPEAGLGSEHHPGPLRRGHLGRAGDLWQAWLRRRAERREAAALRREAGAIHAGPLPQADLDSEHHAGPLRRHEEPVVKAEKVVAARARLTDREKRWIRRRRRIYTEEVLGWILVPVILISSYWAVKAGLNALGTNFTSLLQGIRTAISAAGKG